MQDLSPSPCLPRQKALLVRKRWFKKAFQQFQLHLRDERVPSSWRAHSAFVFIPSPHFHLWGLLYFRVPEQWEVSYQTSNGLCLGLPLTFCDLELP